MKSPEAGGGNSRPHNLELSSLRVLPEQKPVGWGVKKPKGLFQQAPKSGEFQLPPPQSEGVVGGAPSRPSFAEQQDRERLEKSPPDGENPYSIRLRPSRENPDKWELVDSRGGLNLRVEATPDLLESSPEEVQALFETAWKDIRLSLPDFYKFIARKRKQPSTDEDQ